MTSSAPSPTDPPDSTDAELSSDSAPNANPAAAGDASIGRVVLKPNKAGPFFARHPWVLDTSVAAVVDRPQDGGVVDVVAENGRWVARGIFNGQSKIRVRLYSWQENRPLDRDLWKERITQAIELRGQLGYDDPQGAARLIFSEADGLSGLIVDRFANHLVTQVTSLAMAVRYDEILDLLVEALAPESVTARTDPAVVKAEGCVAVEGATHGSPPRDGLVISEHGVLFRVEMGSGQKTGFFLDQRENRRAAAGYLRGRSVLDVCCYSGGFSLAASVLGGAASVLGIDSSAAAIALANENASLNGATAARFEVGDCFESLVRLGQEGRRFSGIILDPPRFAGSRRVLDQALRAYHRLNKLAVSVLEPGGILVTCSCSGHVGRDDFLQMLAGVAQKTRRDIQVLEQRGAAPDHPLRTSCPETHYLKCLICRVL